MKIILLIVFTAAMVQGTYYEITDRPEKANTSFIKALMFLVIAQTY